VSFTVTACSESETEFSALFCIALTDPLLGPNLFSVEVIHQSSFFGFGTNLEYLNDSISIFDNLLIDEWSNAKVDEILSYLGCRRDEKVHVY
jgi:hypothetical protein